MGHLDVDFKFHNVGQGLFYSGRLTYGKASFNFVYDCGAWEYGKADYYRNLIKNVIKGEFSKYDKIDLLIISHLHADHTNGLLYLLNRVRKVDTVILPYLTPTERLLVALQTPVAPRWWYKFIADPTGFLLTNGVKRVILIGGKEPSDEENWLPKFDIPSNSPLKGEFIIDLKELPDDESLKSKIEKLEPEIAKERRVKVKNHSGILPVLITKSPIWIFRFFNYKVKSDKILKQFKEECVEKILGSITPETIKEVIQDKHALSKLRKCYKTHIKSDLNETSLLVLHLPAFDPRDSILWGDNRACNCCWYPCRWWFGLPFKENSKKSLSQLLTGDINLKNGYTQIRTHFGLGNIIKNTVITLIPHHGSKKNWNNALYGDISSNLWVVSAGIHNKYGHPSPEVLGDLCWNSEESCVVWVNEAAYFRLMGVLEF